MHVQKRDGRKEAVHFDKITARITKLAYGLSAEFCDPVREREEATIFFLFFSKCSLSMLDNSDDCWPVLPPFSIASSAKVLSHHFER